MDALIPIILFGVIFGIFYVYISARNKERMAIIEKGTEFDLSIFENKKRFDFKGLLLRFGFLCLGVGLGIMVGIFIENSMFNAFHRRIYHPNSNIFYYQDNSPPLYFSMVFIFGGLGLILGYFIGRNKGE